MKRIFAFLSVVSFFCIGSLAGVVSAAAATKPAAGTLAGSCSMQTNQSWQVTQNGAVDSSGKALTNMPAGFGGATYPVTYCPNSGSHMSIKCDTGWKPVMQSVTQMDCRTSNAASMCWTYFVTYSCAFTGS